MVKPEKPPPPPPVVPTTSRAINRMGLREGKARAMAPRGSIFAVRCGAAIVTGRPRRGDGLACAVAVVRAGSDEGDLQRAILAVGRAAREGGFLSSSVDSRDLPRTTRLLRQHGWTQTEDGYRQDTAPSTRALRVVPVPAALAKRVVGDVHSHNDPAKGAFFSVGVVGSDGTLLCVAQAGTINARRLMHAAGGLGAEVIRVASTRDQSERADPSDPRSNAASMALGACVRVLLALGYRRVVSYTMLGELGWSYRVAGWKPVAITAPKKKGSNWDRPSRPRKKAPTNAGRKVRWETGPDAVTLDKPQREAMDATIEEHLWPENRRPRVARDNPITTRRRTR